MVLSMNLWVAFDEFCALEPKHALSFVIAAKAGMTESGIALRLECKKSFRTIPPTLSPSIPYFCKKLGQKRHRKAEKKGKPFRLSG
jgi:hypothetical protein